MFHYSELIPRVQPQLQKASASGLSMIEILERELGQICLFAKGSIKRILSQYVWNFFRTVLWEEHNDAVNRERRTWLQ